MPTSAEIPENFAAPADSRNTVGSRVPMLLRNDALTPTPWKAPKSQLVSSSRPNSHRERATLSIERLTTPGIRGRTDASGYGINLCHSSSPSAS
jgi:hypothetical protein